MNNYVCLDIGASSGKMSLGYLKNGILAFKEVHRFKNGVVSKKNKITWDLNMLINEALIGLKKVKRMGISDCKLGIDTWAIDYALIDEQGELIDDIYSYRDKRTNGVFKKLPNNFNLEEIYEKTGIVNHEFNTIYQLWIQKIWEYKNLNKILLLPDYISFKLTGKIVAEATNLSTTQLYDKDKKDFIQSSLDFIKIDRDKFGEIIEPGQVIGKIKKELVEKYDLPECEVVSVCTHDTSSAIVSMPTLKPESVFISSGTWSLLGVELDKSVVNHLTYKNKFTNQLGLDDKVTFLKNIIGLWILQEIEKNLSNKFTTRELLDEAEKYDSFEFIMNCEDKRYLMPENMMYEIFKYFDESGLKIPFDIGAIVRCVVDSLALSYNDSLKMLENVLNREIKEIFIFGGGCQNSILNQTVSNLAKVKVHAGPIDATMIGNIITQMISYKEIKDLNEARDVIMKSFEIKTYTPDEIDYTNVIRKFNLIKEMGKK